MARVGRSATGKVRRLS